MSKLRAMMIDLEICFFIINFFILMGGTINSDKTSHLTT